MLTNAISYMQRDEIQRLASNLLIAYFMQAFVLSPLGVVTASRATNGI